MRSVAEGCWREVIELQAQESSTLGPLLDGPAGSRVDSRGAHAKCHSDAAKFTEHLPATGYKEPTVI